MDFVNGYVNIRNSLREKNPVLNDGKQERDVAPW